MAAPKRGPSGKRVGWSKLSTSYRARLTGAGVTRSDWEAGADLRTARGKAPARPDYAAPADVVERLLGGEALRDDLEKVQAFLGPEWTRGLDPDVRAALSQIPFPPSQWADVIITPRGDEAPWTMRVVRKGRPSNGIVTDRGGNDHAVTAYDVTIEIPGGGAPGSGGRQVLELLSNGPPGDDYDDDWDSIDFDLTESE